MCPIRRSRYRTISRRACCERKQPSWKLEAEANKLFAEGFNAFEASGRYVRASLFVAALFFAAISKTFEVRGLRVIVVGLSAALLLFGLISLLPLPKA